MSSQSDPFKLPRFYPILDTAALAKRSRSVVAFGEALLTAGAKILQYRHKEPWTRIHFEDAKRLATLAKAAGALFVINDRVDFANLLEAAVHLGQTDLSPVAARKIVTEGTIGFSTHTRAQLQRGDEEPVNYLALGPIYPTTSKVEPDPVVGLEGLRTLRPLTAKPLVAIGGITLDNAPEVVKAGADSVATVAGILPTEFEQVSSIAREWLRRTS